MVALEAVWRRGGDNQGPPQEGDQLWPGQALMRIFSSTEMEVQLTVAEPDGAALVEGTRALVRLDAYPNLEFKARFDSASPVASSLLDSPIRTFPARFRLEDRDPHLLPDLTAAVDIEISTPAPVPAVPRAAVHYRRSRAYVTRIADGGARRENEVGLGVFDDSYVEVKSGLAQGDRVALPSGPAEKP
jgi:multidrug efflux pump subunit AcrA (membrane-fusion protein)